METRTATNSIGWRSLLKDNLAGIAVLFFVFFISFPINAIGFLGFILFLSGLPFVLAMLPLSYVALLIHPSSEWRARWWFIASLISWAIAPLLGGLLYPLLNSLGSQPAVVSDPGAFVVWTQWLWALPFMAWYSLVGLIRNNKPSRAETVAGPAVA